MNEVKQGLGLLGLLAAVFALALDSDTLFWVTIGLLGASVAIRIVQALRARQREN